ncbi:exosortase-associated EpsI family protein [Aeoliella mucimassa]|uniref:Methanolan biosynthesis EpsI domain-containing protein n=1 Tax=Aeoliella mucimassa TaxID=2527972 RepID=A0A518ALQ8_9BACT|nr:exosortase-associated EpsI family protein [Aeoliella mucimassa]QDU55670.1 hypothetical protein Pan181_18630 [Aeoliella mucimassa]
MPNTQPGQNMMLRWGALALAVLLLLSGGVIYGGYSHRWGPGPDLEAAANQLATMPETVGDWILVEETPLPTYATDMLQCAGHINRKYVNKTDGSEIAVAITVGPPGPIAVHTPEICFSSRAYEIQAPRKVVTIDSGGVIQDRFWQVDFTTRNLMASGLRVMYAWSDGEAWKASESPRFDFAASSMLYKLQIASSVSPTSTQVDEGPATDFLRQLVRSNWDLYQQSSAH